MRATAPKLGTLLLVGGIMMLLFAPEAGMLFIAIGALSLAFSSINKE